MKALAALMLMTAMFFAAGCKPEDGPNNGGNNGGGNDSIIDTHEYVDLCLPSGTLWATCNVGAETTGGYGDYFAWGETQPKEVYDWSTYKYCNGSYNNLTKYCDNEEFGSDHFTDTLNVLLPEDDAATANWGEGWRMPTYDEWVELDQNTTQTWVNQNGVDGRLFTAENGNSLFLPGAGFCNENYHLCYGDGFYWASSLGTSYPYYGKHFYFVGGSNQFFGYRCQGIPVRPVRSAH